MLVDEGVVTMSGDPAAAVRVADAVRVPPTIGALLAARLDRLPFDERSTAQRASVVGRAFERVAVAALTPPTAEADLTASLLGLVRRELVTPERAELTADAAFKFRHILIRDAAYEGLAKADRAELHERFAGWLEGVAGDRIMEYEEILGYHLELAHRYRTELRERGDHTALLGARAAVRLIAAGRRARDRGDSAAAAELFQRAEALPIADPLAAAELQLAHGLALWDLGRTAEALVRADSAFSLASTKGDRRLTARARLLRLDIRRADGTYADSDAIVGSERAAVLSDAEASGDPLAMALARQSLAEQAWTERRFTDSQAEIRRATEHARQTGDPRFELESEVEMLVSSLSGPDPAGGTVTLAQELLNRATDYPTVRARILPILAVAEAMLGWADLARRHGDEAVVIYQDLAQPSGVATARLNTQWVARLAGDLVTAHAELRLLMDEERGDASIRPWANARLAEILLAQGRIDEAERALAESERDPVPVLRPRQAASRARIDASRGDPGAAVKVGELLAMVSGTLFINQETDALIDAAEAMASLGDFAAATGHATRALRMAEAKENLALAGQIRLLLARLAG
jgi:tetratricopeptide (TPR) repeat protein